jgi:hypothetical protein
VWRCFSPAVEGGGGGVEMAEQRGYATVAGITRRGRCLGLRHGETEVRKGVSCVGEEFGAIFIGREVGRRAVHGSQVDSQRCFFMTINVSVPRRGGDRVASLTGKDGAVTLRSLARRAQRPDVTPHRFWLCFT